MDLIEPLKDPEAVLRTRGERAVATALQGSCQVPLAVYAELNGQELKISAMVGMPDGSEILRSEKCGVCLDVDRISALVAEDLLGQGAPCERPGGAPE